MVDLMRAKRDFKALFKDSRDALFIADGEGIIREVNSAAQDMFGLTRKEILGRHVRDFYYSRTDPDTLWDTLRETGSVKDFEKELRRKNGTLLTCLVSASVKRNKTGEVTAINGIIHDISDRKRVEEDLRRERNLVSAILETSGALVVLLDPQGRFLRLNQSFEAATGWGITDLVGKPMWDAVLVPQEAEEFRAMFSDIVSSGDARQHRCRLLSRNGGERQVVWSLTVLSRSEQTEGFVVVSGIDLTELENARQKVKTLSGLLPICASCKRIRDDGGYWSQIEEYIQQHSEADFSHGLCPECLTTLYPKVAESLKNQSNDPDD